MSRQLRKAHYQHGFVKSYACGAAELNAYCSRGIGCYVHFDVTFKFQNCTNDIVCAVRGIPRLVAGAKHKYSRGTFVALRPCTSSSSTLSTRHLSLIK